MTLNQKLLLTTFLTIISFQNAYCAGYSTNLLSASGLGNSYAGSATGIHDVSDIFFNPSLTTGLKSTEAVASASYLMVKSDPDSVSAQTAGGQVRGNETNNGGIDALVPAFYIGTTLGKKSALGLSITSPFGLSTKYDKTWAGRYRAIESKITTVNINPSLSYKLTDNLSLGVGAVAQYAQMILTRAVYTGGNDAYAKIKGDDWAYGYNLGVNYSPTKKVKLGLGYRSKIDYNIAGQARVTELNLYSDFGARTSTPESLTAGIAFIPNKNLELAYDLTWTAWSRVKSLNIHAYQNSSLNSITSYNWKDSYLHSLGANFGVSEKLKIRTGVAYERDATTNFTRDPRIPTGDRIWASLGVSYKFNTGTSVDLSYVHQFFSKVSVNLENSDNSSSTLSANYKNRTDIVSLGIRQEF